MLSALLGVLGSLFGWLGSLLPASPFGEWLNVTQDMQLGLGWLNWFLPISDFLLMLAAWIAVCLAVTAIRVALEMTSSVGGKVIGD